ncbi:MAG: hypothetical protein JNK38_01040 [Acidobacteria bacterium]|nr:hypothetical protein [Acidobacteriota bacterium]
MNWQEVEPRIQALKPGIGLVETRILGVLCAAYKVGADVQRIADLTGYKTGDVHDALTELRNKMLVMNKLVAERDVLRALPGAEPLLKGLLVDQLPAIEALSQPNPSPENKQMEQEFCKCGRPARHRGYCKGSRGKASRNSTTTQHAPAATIEVSGVSFRVYCETDGQKYEASGSSLPQFNAAMSVVERMLGA